MTNANLFEQLCDLHRCGRDEFVRYDREGFEVAIAEIDRIVDEDTVEYIERAVNGCGKEFRTDTVADFMTEWTPV